MIDTHIQRAADRETAQDAPARFAARVVVARFAMAAVLILTFAAGIGVERYGINQQGNAVASSSLTDLPAFETLQQTWDLIHSRYVDVEAIDDEALLYGAAAGMVDALGDDGHTTFLDPEQAKAWRQSARGQLIGVGLQIDIVDGRPVVLSTVDGAPADEAGIQAKDVIQRIDSQSTQGLTQSDLVRLLRGEEGTSVELTLLRPSEDREYTVTLERRRITVKPVTWTMLPGNVAFIRISQFIDGTIDGVRLAVNEANELGAVAIVLDLRDNPGGLVREALGVASQFLPEGKAIYQYQERDGNPSPVNSVGIGVATEIPLVVLINGGSASAAEIVASALQENGRAETVGETTFGTGTVLSPIELNDGSMLVLGTGLWLTPGGEQMWHIGVEPSIRVDLLDGAEPLRPDSAAGLTLIEIQQGEDTQLARAYAEVTPS